MSRLNGSNAVTDGSLIYYVAPADPLIPSLVRLSPTGALSSEKIDDWAMEVHFGSPYGSDRFVVVATAWERPPDVAGKSESKLYLYTGTRTTAKLDRRVCLANALTPHAYAVVGKTLLLASQVQGRNAQGIVKWSLP